MVTMGPTVVSYSLVSRILFYYFNIFKGKREKGKRKIELN